MNLKNLRLQKRITLAQLSKKSNLAVGYISDLENGKCKNPSLKTLTKLANALGVSVSELLDENKQVI